MGSTEAAIPAGANWTSPEPGVHQRNLDSLESMYAALADSGAALQREQWDISSAVQLSFPSRVSDPIPYLKKAWAATRRLSPALGATLSPPDPTAANRTMTVAETSDEQWLKQSFFVQNSAKNATDLSSELNATNHGAHWIPSSSEILIRLSHWMIDGKGTMKLWGNFLTLLATFIREGLNANPVTQEGPLTRSLSDLFGCFADSRRSDVPKHLKDAADEWLSMAVKGMPSIGPPLKPGADAEGVIPGLTKRFPMSLDETSTKAVIAACKAKKVSVSAMVHTAVIRVVAAYPQHPACKHISTMVPVDLRTYLPAPYNDDAHATGAFATAWNLYVPDVGTESFEDLSKKVNAVYKMDFHNLTVDDEGNPVGLPEITIAAAGAITDLFMTPPPPEMPPITTPSVSSLGFVERYIHREYDCGNGEKFAVEDFFLGSEMLTKEMWSHIWTFRDRLNIPLVYNDNFHDESQIKEISDKVAKELLDGLQISQ